MSLKQLTFAATTFGVTLLFGLKAITALSFVTRGIAAPSTLLGLSALVIFGMLAIALLQPAQFRPLAVRRHSPGSRDAGS